MLSIRKSIARQSSLQEKYVYLVNVLSFRPEGAKIIGSNEALSFSIKNSFQKIMKLLFKLGVWKASRASIKCRKVPSTHMI